MSPMSPESPESPPGDFTELDVLETARTGMETARTGAGGFDTVPLGEDAAAYMKRVGTMAGYNPDASPGPGALVGQAGPDGTPGPQSPLDQPLSPGLLDPMEPRSPDSG